MRGVGGARVCRRVIDELALDPQCRRLRAQPVEDLLTGSCSHWLLRALVRLCSIIERMIRMSNETVAPSQTLDRGLACLDFIAASERAVSVDATATALGLHRSIVYRLLRTLELRHLVERDAEGDYSAGTYLAVLSRSVRRSLRAAAAPVLATLVEDLEMTAFLVVADGAEA